MTVPFDTVDPFDPMPRRAPCPVCFTNNWVERQRTHRSYSPDGEELWGVTNMTAVVCGTCERTPKTYVQGADPATGRGPFNF